MARKIANKHDDIEKVTNTTNKKKSRNNGTSRSKRSTTASKTNMDSMKYEVARELGVKLGADASSRSNGKVGGEITKRLTEAGKKNLR